MTSKKEKRIKEITDFMLKNKTVPSWKTLSKEFGISRTTAYALLNEILARNEINTKDFLYEKIT